MPDFTEDDLVDLFNAADTNSDGKLNYDEFRRARTNLS